MYLNEFTDWYAGLFHVYVGTSWWADERNSTEKQNFHNQNSKTKMIWLTMSKLSGDLANRIFIRTWENKAVWRIESMYILGIEDKPHNLIKNIY